MPVASAISRTMSGSTGPWPQITADLPARTRLPTTRRTSSWPDSQASWLMPSSRLIVDARRGGEGRDRRDAAHRGRRHDPLRRPRREGVDERGRLLHAALDERPRGIGALPAAAADRLAVPDEQERERARDALVDELRERVEDLDVGLVAEVAAGAPDGDPLERRDLGVRLERRPLHGPLAHLGRPVVHDLLAAARQRVPGDAERDAEGDLESGLLCDLAHRRARQRLARIDLALGDGDVAVDGAVHHQHVHLAVDHSPADGPRGVDRRRHRRFPVRVR